MGVKTKNEKKLVWESNIQGTVEGLFTFFCDEVELVLELSLGVPNGGGVRLSFSRKSEANGGVDDNPGKDG